MLMLILLTTLTFHPTDLVKVDQVDVIELNHTPTFNQWIFWRWNGNRYEVVAWRIDKGQRLVPKNRLRFGDREIRSVSFRETWTMYDPEMLDREYLPPEYRKGLQP